MNNVVAVDNGKMRGADDVAFADKIIETKNTKGQWATIELLVNAWAKRTPEDFRAFKVQLNDYRLGLFDRKYGQTAGGKDHERRFTMAFPEELFFMIRAIYKADELPMDRAFYNEFLKRFPLFRIPEKL